MQLAHDEPGWRLTLTAPEAQAPVGPIGCVAALFLLVFVFGLPAFDALPLLWRFVTQGELPSSGALLGLGASFLFLLLSFGAISASAVRATRGLRLLDVDRGPGTLRFAERAAFGLYARDATLSLGDMEEALVVAAPGRRGTQSPTVRVTLRVRPPGTRPGTREGLVEHALSFAVEGLDRREEVADFALRLGAAAGLGAFRVVRNDARDVEVLLGFGYEGGFEPLRAPDTPADYARDSVAAPARQAVAEERVPPFEPTSFDGQPPLREWAPGHRVLFHKRWGLLATLFCLPFALLPLGPLALALGAGTVEGSRVAGAAVLLVLTLPVAGLATYGLWLALPRTAELDWTRGTLAVRRGWSTREIALSALEAIELRGESRRHKPKNGAAYFTYRCYVSAWYRNATGGSDRQDIVRTNEYRDDPDTPWRAAFPLATELAQVLGVKRRVTEFDA